MIDVGDNASRHNLCSISTLLGLPKDLDLKGEKYSDRQAEARPDRGGVPHGQRAGHQEPRPTEEHRGEHQPVPAELPAGDCAAVGTGMAQERRRATALP